MFCDRSTQTEDSSFDPEICFCRSLTPQFHVEHSEKANSRPSTSESFYSKEEPSRISTAQPFYSCSDNLLFSEPDEPKDDIVDINKLNNNDTPRKRKLKFEINRLTYVCEKRRKAMKNALQRNRRLVKKIENLRSLLNDLENENLVNSDERQLLSSFEDSLPIKELISRKVSKSKGASLPKKYSPSLRSFALTLHYYSPRAYEYVREKFNTCLPHSRTIKRWYQSLNGNAGFTTEAFKALKQKVSISGERIIAGLIIDEMAIRQQVEWDGEKYHGYVDFGAPENEDSSTIAKEALVFLLTSLTENWKIPVGYFLVEGVRGSQRATLVNHCLEIAAEHNVDIVSALLIFLWQIF